MERKAVTQKAKLEAFSANALCPYCGGPFEGDVEFHHDPPLALLGEDHDIKPMIPCHKECHEKQTELWRPFITKAKRQAGETGQQARRRRNGSRLKSRGFDKTYRKKLNGEVVRNE